MRNIVVVILMRIFAIVFFALACGSKSVAIPLVAIMLGLEIVMSAPGTTVQRLLIVSCWHLPSVAVAGFVFQQAHNATHDEVDLAWPVNVRLVRAAWAVAFHFWGHVLPAGFQGPILEYVAKEEEIKLEDSRFALAAGFVVITSFGAAWLAQRGLVCLFRSEGGSALWSPFVWCAYLALLSPGLGLASAHGGVCSLTQDRYSYVAAFVVGVPVLQQFLSKFRGPLSTSFVFAISAVLGYASQSHIVAWSTDRSLCSGAISVDPRQSLPRLLLAEGLLEDEHLSEAAIVLQGAAATLKEQRPEDGHRAIWCNHLMGKVFKKQQKWQESEHFLRAALGVEWKWNSVRAPVWDSLGQILGTLERHQEAYVALVRGVRGESNDGHKWQNLGVVLSFGLGRISEAKYTFAQAVKFLPTRPEAWALLSQTQRRTGEAAKSEESLKVAEMLEPQRRDQFRDLVRSGDVEPDANLDGLYAKCVQLLNAKRHAEAVTFGRAVVAAAPAQHGPLSALGGALAMTGNGREAVEFLRQAVRLAPTIVDHRVNLASVHSGFGEWESSLKQIGKVLRLDPSHAHAKALKKEVLAARKKDGARHKDGPASQSSAKDVLFLKERQQVWKRARMAM